MSFASVVACAFCETWTGAVPRLRYVVFALLCCLFHLLWLITLAPCVRADIRLAAFVKFLQSHVTNSLQALVFSRGSHAAYLPSSQLAQRQSAFRIRLLLTTVFLHLLLRSNSLALAHLTNSIKALSFPDVDKPARLGSTQAGHDACGLLSASITFPVSNVALHFRCAGPASMKLLYSSTGQEKGMHVQEIKQT